MPKHELDELISRALRKAISRQYDGAIEEYRPQLEMSLEKTHPFMQLGNNCCQKDDLDSAIDCYLFTAKLLTLNGFYSRAAAVYKQILQLDEFRADIRSALHDLYDKLGVTYISDQDIRHWQATMGQFESEGKFTEAIQASELLLKNDPLNPEVLIKLTELCMKAGELDRGNTYFRQAAYQLMKRKMNPRTEELLAQLGASNPYCNVPPGELIENLKLWMRVITNFVVAYFPNKDPWESEREMGTRSAQDFRKEYIRRAEIYLSRGLTPLEAFGKIKGRLAEHEKDYYRFLRRQLSESRKQEVN